MTKEDEAMAAKWIEDPDPLECGVDLPARVLDLTGRSEAVAESYARTKSLRKTAAEFGISHEKVRTLVSRYSPLKTGE